MPTNTNNEDDITREQADTILDGVGAGSTVEWNDTPATPEQILADIHTAIAGVPPAADRAAASLTEMSRLFPTIPERFANFSGFARGGVISRSEARDRYIGESPNYEMETLIPLDRAERLLRGRYSMSYRPDHGPSQAHPDQEDDTNREVVMRWRGGAANEAEISRARQNGLGCPCVSCLTDVFNSIQSSNAPRPEGYADDCTCPSCRAWRRDMALGIQEFILNGVTQRPPAREYNMNVRRTAESMLSGPDMADALAMSMSVGTVTGTERPDGQIEVMIHGDTRPARRAIQAAAAALRPVVGPTPFERRREGRGHPVPKAALAADWKPNDWEA